MPEGGSSVGERFAGAEPKFFRAGRKGINTQTTRENVEDDQFSWLENLQPIGADRKALYDKGTAIYTATGGKTIVYACMFNISATTYAAIFLSDGTAVQVNTATNAVTSISSVAGTFYPTTSGLSTPLPQACQYGQSYLIIVSAPVSGATNNGYWIWDGALLYGAGTLSPVVTITNAGSAYSSAPTISISGGSGSGATLVAQ